MRNIGANHGYIMPSIFWALCPHGLMVDCRLKKFEPCSPITVVSNRAKARFKKIHEGAVRLIRIPVACGKLGINTNFILDIIQRATKMFFDYR